MKRMQMWRGAMNCAHRTWRSRIFCGILRMDVRISERNPYADHTQTLAPPICIVHLRVICVWLLWLSATTYSCPGSGICSQVFVYLNLCCLVSLSYKQAK